MRAAIARLTDPLFGWIPDVTVVPRSRQVALGATISVAVHVLLFLAAIIMAMVVPQRVERAPMAAQQNLEVTIVPMPVPQPLTVRQKPTPIPLGTLPGLKAGQKPKDAVLQSDEDMSKGSEKPATGDIPLPSQEGEKRLETFNFADQEVVMRADEFATRFSRSPSEEPQPAQETPQSATVAPMYAPQPVAKTALAAAEKAAPQEKLPEPARPTRATPLPKVAAPGENQLAFQTPQMTPERLAPPPVPNARSVDKPTTATQYAALSTPKPIAGPSLSDRYKEQLRKQRIEGSISNRGPAGIDAVKTAGGRWWKRTKEAIGYNWNIFIHENSGSVTPGVVAVSFTIGRGGGRASDVRVESNSGNSTCAEVCVRAILETPVPPPPPELLESQEGERIEQVLTFNLY